MKEYVLYGTPKGLADWHEEILFESTDRTQCEKVQSRYETGDINKLNMYDRFRISCVDLSIPPDFTKVIR
jgi:hypothetical protein